MHKKLFYTILPCLMLFACKTENEKTMTKESIMMSNTQIKIPIAEKQDHTLTNHGDTRIDPYYWMKLSDEQKNAKTPDEKTLKVVNYLTAENEYKEKMLAHTENAQESLFNEIVGRIKQTDLSVPYLDNGYYYLTRFEEGKEYAIHARKKGTLDAAEEIMLDENKLSEGFDFYSLGGRSVSPSNKLLAYGEDTLSRRIYTVKFKNLETGEMLEDVIPNTTGGITWANDNKTVFYTTKDKSLRSFKVFKHVLGTDASEDKEVYHEKDETFSTFIYKTKSKKYLVIGSYATLSQEYRILNANNPAGNFEIFQDRERKLEYGITHFKDKWYVKTNLDAKNFRLMSCPEGKTTKKNWSEVIPHRKDVLLEGMEVFEDFTVLSERIKGITQLRVIPEKGDEYYIDFGEDAYLAYVSVNRDFNTNILRLGFTSLTTPNSTFDFNMNTKEKTLLKQQEVVGEFRPEDYTSERIYAIAKDGTEVFWIRIFIID